MDEPKQDSKPESEAPNTDAPSGAPTVMSDVKPPEHKPVPEVPSDVVETMTSTSSPERPPMPTSPVTEPASSPEETPKPTSSVDHQPQTTVEQSNTTQTAKPVVVKASKNSLKIVIAVIVAALLIGATIYFYLDSNESTKKAAGPGATQETQLTQIAPATTADVDQTVAEVDEALNTAEAAQDVSTEDLSDTALGL
jgi:uncharacterized protein HemX